MGQGLFFVFTAFIVAFATAFPVTSDTRVSEFESRMSDTPDSLLSKFVGKYYYNDDRNYNFVAAEPFKSEEEKNQMIRLFKPSVPKAREDMPALKIMMLRPGARTGDALFVHDTLYNIETTDR